MAQNKREFTVLCPSGRRVTIKTTSSTSIGQIIEEACLKQNLDPLGHNLKQLNKILDPSSTIQYSNVPNRAQLELIPTEKRRQELNVTVNLEAEEGRRIISEFPSNTTLEEMLVLYESVPGNNFSLPSFESGSEPFIVYTMRKIMGEELKSVTLKSLGLYGGKCLIRYGTQQRLSENGSKASVSGPIVIVSKKKESPLASSNHDKTSSADLPITPEPMDCDVPQAKEPLPIRVSEAEDNKIIIDNSIAEDNPVSNQDNCDPIDEEHVNTSMTDDIEAPVACATSYCDELNEVTEGATNLEEHIVEELESPAPKVILLSEDHNSILFSMDDAPSTVQSDESEEFFSLSQEEVFKLHAEQRQKLKEIEEAPLMTSQLRDLERDSKVLTAMNKHPITQLRIHFPDQHVIQANFKPHNKIGEVKDFLRPLLIRRDLEFELGTYNRQVLGSKLTLVDAECIPKSRLYFMSQEKESTFLSEETLSKKSTFDAAAKSVSKSKKSKSPQTDNPGAIPKTSNSRSQNASRKKPSNDDAMKKLVKLSKKY